MLQLLYVKYKSLECIRYCVSCSISIRAVVSLGLCNDCVVDLSAHRQ